MIQYSQALKSFRIKIAPVVMLAGILGVAGFVGQGLLFSAEKSSESQQEADLNFADRLAEESNNSGGLNFLDIIEELVQDIAKKPASKRIAQHVILISGKLKKFSAWMERDPAQRTQLMNESIEILGKFIKENVDYSGISEAKFELSELLQGKARDLSSQARVETDPVKKQELISQVESTYVTINEYLNVMIKDYQKTLEGITDFDKREEVDSKIMRASYTLGLNFYYQGLLYAKGSDNNKKYLQDATKTFGLFALRWGDKLLAYDAADLAGLCYYELGDYKKARAYFTSTASLYKSLMDDDEKTKEEKAEIIHECRDLIQKGYAHMAMVANAEKDYAEALKIINDLLKLFPKDQADEWMEMGLLEKARALFATNKKEEALIIIKGVKDNSKNNSARSAANEALNILIKDDVNVPPAIVIATMRDLLVRKRHDELVQQGQLLMARLNVASDDERNQYLPEALLIMAESYKSQERFYEAAIFYETVYLNPKYKDAKSSQNEDIAPLAAYWASAVYLSMGVASDDESDRAKYRDIRAYLIKTWPKSDFATSSQFYQGKEFENSGRYLDAAKSYGEVPTSNSNYFESLFRIGFMHQSYVDRDLLMAYRKEKDAKKRDEIKSDISKNLSLAESAFAKALKVYDEKSKAGVDEESKRKIEHNELQTRMFMSRLYLNEFFRKYAQILAILDGFEKRYASRPDVVSQILQMKIEAYINMGEIDNAEIHLKSLQDYARKGDNMSITAPALQLMGVAYEKNADSAIPGLLVSAAPDERKKALALFKDKQVKDSGEYKNIAEIARKSGDYFYQWGELRKQTMSPDEALAVAEKLFRIADILEDEVFYRRAADLYERVINKEFQDKLPRQDVWLIQWKFAMVLRALKDNDKAVAILEMLDKEKPSNVDIKRELALTYESLGSRDNVVPWNSAKRKWAELSRLFKEQSEGWWECKYSFIELDVKIGNFKEALYGMDMIENGISPDYDNNQWGYKDKFNNLRNTASGK